MPRHMTSCGGAELLQALAVLLQTATTPAARVDRDVARVVSFH
jgi:hypothetical protein